MRLKNLIPKTATLQLYKAATLSYLTCYYLTWHFCRESDRRKLERIQQEGLDRYSNDKQSGYEAVPTLYRT